jgi:hypothetical protein
VSENPTSEPAAAAPEMSLGQSLVAAIVVLVVAIGIPVTATVLIGGFSMATAGVIGALFGLLLAVKSGWRRALQLLPVLLVSTVLGALTVGTPWWAALLAAIGFAAGIASRVGLLAPFALIGMAAACMHRLDELGSLATLVLWLCVAALWAIAVARWLRIPPVVAGRAVPGRIAIAGGVVLALVAGTAALLGQRSGDPLGYWMPVLVFVLVLPTPGMRWSAYAREKVYGTAAGVAIGFVLAWIEPPPVWTIALALMAAVLMLAVHEPVWLGAIFTTLALVLLLAPRGEVAGASETRFVALIVAVCLVMIGAALLVWWARRHPAPRAELQLAAALIDPDREPAS